MSNHQGVGQAVESPMDFSKRLNLKFKDGLILSRALTHRSYLNENQDALEDNERLEFLGDAILDFVVGAWLYNHFPEMAEGELTRLRAALVRTEQLAEFARDLDLGAALRLGRGEEEGGGRYRDAMLCGAYEALMGAIYLDQGIPAIEVFIATALEEATASILNSQRHKDPKSGLQEWAQGQGFRPPHYIIISEDGPDHAKTFVVEVEVDGKPVGRGTGRSKQGASKMAAAEALKKING